MEWSGGPQKLRYSLLNGLRSVSERRRSGVRGFIAIFTQWSHNEEARYATDSNPLMCHDIIKVKLIKSTIRQLVMIVRRVQLNEMDKIFK